MRLSGVKSPASRQKRSRWSVVPSGEEPTDDTLVSPCRLGLKGLQAGIFRLDRTTSSGIADQRHYVRASTVDSHKAQLWNEKPRAVVSDRRGKWEHGVSRVCIRPELTLRQVG